jgi:hypothetical protein
MESSDSVAFRTRRTVPLNEAEEEEDDDTFITCSSKLTQEDHNLFSSSQLRSNNGSIKGSTSTPRRSISSTKLDRHSKQPSAQRRARNGESSHSRQSYDSGSCSSADTMMTPHTYGNSSRLSATSSGSNSLRYSDGQNTNSSKTVEHRPTPSRKSSGSRTPSSNSKKLTIGPDCGLGSSRSYIPSQHGCITSYSAPQSSVLPDLFSIERTFSQGSSGPGDDSQRRRDIFYGEKTSLDSTPVAWKTPFEVDAPRETPRSYRQEYRSRQFDSPSQVSAMSVPTTTNSRLSEEQDAWAGIDALLETRSMNDSFDFSTRDILPSSTVKAMRRDDDASVMIDDDASEYSETPYLGLKKLTLKKTARQDNGMPHLVEASDQDEDSDSKAGGAGTSTGTGTLFDVFHWSQKENVDEKNQRKVKLNTRRVQLKTNSQHDQSDVSSLPSLATCREDELSTRSEISDTHTQDDKGSVVTEDFRSLHQERIHQSSRQAVVSSTIKNDIPQSIGGTDDPQAAGSFNAVYGGKLVLDKSVDDYIQKIQKHLPTISETGSPTMRGKVKGRVAFRLDMEESKSTLDSSALEELPSLNAFSNSGPNSVSSDSSNGRKKEEKEKRDPNLSLSSKFMKSIKGMRAPKTPKPPSKKGVVNGDEQKYFPDAAQEENDSKRFSANRCLLNEDEEDDVLVHVA